MSAIRRGPRSGRATNPPFGCAKTNQNANQNRRRPQRAGHEPDPRRTARHHPPSPRTPEHSSRRPAPEGTLYYRQWTEFIVHRIEHYPAAKGIYYFVSRDDGIRKLIYSVGSREPYLSRTYHLVEEHAHIPKQQPHPDARDKDVANGDAR